MRRILSLLTLLAVLLLFYNQAANWHYHTLANGMVVAHAHPYAKASTPPNGSPFANHSHSDFELLVIGLISSVLVLALFFIPPAIQCPEFWVNSNPKPKGVGGIKSLPATINPLRGPPIAS